MKTYDFSTLYTTIPHDKLKSRLFQIHDNCFLNKNGTQKYKFLVIGKQDTYFVRNHSDCSHKYSEVDIKSMLGFLIDNIYVVFGDHVFQQSVGIPMGTNCAPLLADLFLYSYEAEFVQKLLTFTESFLLYFLWNWHGIYHPMNACLLQTGWIRFCSVTCPHGHYHIWSDSKVKGCIGCSV